MERQAAAAPEGGGPAVGDQGTDLPSALGRPALRALAARGWTRLEQLADVDPAQLATLHGVGPKALRVLTEALAARRREDEVRPDG